MDAYDKSMDKEDLAKRLKLLGVDIDVLLEQKSKEEKAAKAAEFAAANPQPKAPPQPEAAKPPPGSTVLGGGQGPAWKRPGS